MPGVTEDDQGRPRRVGFELEFGNIAVKDTAEALQKSLGGNLDVINPFRYELNDSPAGTLRVERDAELLHSVKYREYLQALDISFDADSVAREIEEGIDRLSSALIPCEIVTEPLAFENFPVLDDIVGVLNDLGAEGTQQKLTSAYGTHINPSAPGLDADTLLSYIQAFLLLTDWIAADSKIDFARRHFTSFIDPFPEVYGERVLHADYRPSTRKLLSDYLESNPTRNRALDMLPLFSEIDEERTLAGIKKAERSLIKPRPAFHYRLPDCRVGDPDWTVALEWNRWWFVEYLAKDEDLRVDLMEHWNSGKYRGMLKGKIPWVTAVGEFLEDNIQTPGRKRG